ncbi:MAG TPA: dihydrodipicolinate synthase family protein [Flavitalea sp.]|nr:dihydrodipicolinate synthase family protein [Flavitalea sp.]
MNASRNDQSPKGGRRSFLGQLGAVMAVTAMPSSLQANTGSTILQNSTGTSEKKFVPVMLTPYAPDGKIDFNALSKLTDFYLEAGAKGFFANCASSEMYKLSPEERLALGRHVVKHINGEMPVVASGSFGETISQQADFTKAMYHTGVNAVILITSLLATKEESDDRLIEHFDSFMQMTDNIPVGTYECPSPYKRLLTPKVFKYLLESNRLIYHKDTSLDTRLIAEKLQLAKNTRLELYDAHTPNATESMKLGAKGMSAIAGNFYPELYAWLCKNINEPSKQEDIQWLQSNLTRMDKVVGAGYPTSAKYFLNKRGVPFNLICRTNTTPLTNQQTSTLDAFYKELPAWHERLGIKMKA